MAYEWNHVVLLGNDTSVFMLVTDKYICIMLHVNLEPFGLFLEVVIVVHCFATFGGDPGKCWGFDCSRSQKVGI